MGLDMYLTGRKYLGCKYNEKDEKIKIEVKAEWETQPETYNIDIRDIDSIVFDLGQWRKANAIHKWFVDKCFSGNYDDYRGEEIEVEKKQLIELKELCKDVREQVSKAKDIETKRAIIKKMLPMQNGFFFGYTEEDEGIEYYMQDLRDTIKIIDSALKKMEKYKIYEIYYSASW